MSIQTLYNTPKYKKLLAKLDAMYEREEEITQIISDSIKELRQIKQDAELLEMMIMHQTNKDLK